jgi:hypothetical protein
VNPDRLAELEEERRFLLRSLGDLEREHDAGDVDEHDYEVLRDGYTARAANVLRQIDDGRAAMPPKRERRTGAVVGTVIGVLALAVLSGWLVARSSGQRLAGQTITGGQAVDDVAGLLTSARAQMQAGDLQGAAQAYQAVTTLEPDNSEARTYAAWLLVIDSRSQSDETAAVMIDAALTGFEQVTTDDPGYADAHCLYAVAVGRFLPQPEVDLAIEQLQLCKASNPPQEMIGLVDQFLADLVAASSTATTTVTTPP